MNTMTLTQFLDRHKACADGRKRAAAFASLEDAWQHCSPADIIWVATRPGVLTDRELRRFAASCARSVQHLMTDPRSIAAIDVAERHANGEATDDELRIAARAAAAAAADAADAADAAYAAARSAYDAADAAARSAYDAADAAARSAYAAAYAARSAANAASNAAADAADAAAAAADAADAADAAYAAAREQQAAWLRQNTEPNFS